MIRFIFLVMFMFIPAITHGGDFQATGPLNEQKSWRVSTSLADGRVLVSGGCGWDWGSCHPLDTVEIFDPVTGTFSFISGMNQTRLRHTATAIPVPGNPVLIAGGNGKTAELFDPITDSFTPIVSSMVESRTNHSAVVITTADEKKRCSL